MTQKQLTEYATRVASKLNLTADSIVGLDLPMVCDDNNNNNNTSSTPLSSISALACLQANAKFFVPQALPTLSSTTEMSEKENVTHLITEKSHAEQIKHSPAETLQMAMYPV